MGRGVTAAAASHLRCSAPTACARRVERKPGARVSVLGAESQLRHMRGNPEERRKDLLAEPYETAMSAFARTSFIVAAVTVGMLAAVACGKPKEEPLGQPTRTSAAVAALASCDATMDRGSCTDYASTSGSFGVERSLCRTARGEFRLSACPMSSRVGTCLVAEGEVKRYYAGAFTAETARADCEKHGLEGRFLASR